MKKIRIIFSPEAEGSYYGSNETILNSIKNKMQIMQINPHYGNPIAKKMIPREYKVKYEAANLFRVELANYWRMLYTLTGNDEELIIFILDILYHRSYDKKFGYKKS